MRSVRGVSCYFEEIRTVAYLSDFKTIVNLVLEWTHRDLTDQFWLNDRLLHNKR